MPSAHFIKIHRSFVINVSQVDKVHDNYVVISRKTIPLSAAYKAALAARLKLL